MGQTVPQLKRNRRRAIEFQQGGPGSNKEKVKILVGRKGGFVGKSRALIDIIDRNHRKIGLLMMRIKELIDKSYTNPWWRTALHVLFWSFIFASTYYFNTISFASLKIPAINYLLTAKSVLALVLFYYPFVYYVLPRFFLKKRYIKGILLVVILIVVYAAIEAFGDKQVLNNCMECGEQLMKTNPDYYHFLQLSLGNIMLGRIISLGLLYQLLIMLSLPVAIKTGRSYFRQTVQQLQLSRDNLQLEFNFLKSQVNPHFLFNTLNNIYSLVVHDKKQQAAAIIARLSDFMRYALYECNEEQISLKKEVQMLKDYVELEKLRLNQTRVDFTYTTDENDYMIPPLLFMPALENAFKYSADHLQDNQITIDICVADQELRVRIRNNVDPYKQGKKGGIGLQNMQKRLQHYYPGRYTYTVKEDAAVYYMELTCILS